MREWNFYGRTDELAELGRIADALETLAQAPVMQPVVAPEPIDCPHCSSLREELASLAQRVHALELAP